MTRSNNEHSFILNIATALVLAPAIFMFLQTEVGMIVFVAGGCYCSYKIYELLDWSRKHERAAAAVLILFFPTLSLIGACFYWLSGCILGMNNCVFPQ